MRRQTVQPQGGVEGKLERGPQAKPDWRAASVGPEEVAPRCNKCPFAVKGVPCSRPVRPFIPRKHPVGVLIGESPAREDVATGQPFVSRAGDELDLLLAEDNLPRSKLLLLNAIACQPPKGMFNEPNLRAAANACRPWIRSIVRNTLKRPVPTLAMGKWAGYFVTKMSRAVGDRRGFLRVGEQGQHRKLTPLILTWSPGFALFMNPWEAGNFKVDLNRFARATRGELIPGPTELNIAPTLRQIRTLWDEPFITVDIEAAAAHPSRPWTGLDPTQAKMKVVGLGTPDRGFSMWWASTSVAIKREVRKLIAAKRLLKVLQNGWWYDIRVMERFGFRFRNVVDIRDMRRAQVTTSKLSLNYMASLYCDMESWKEKGGDDGKE